MWIAYPLQDIVVDHTFRQLEIYFVVEAETHQGSEVDALRSEGFNGEAVQFTLIIEYGRNIID